jgi:hypothetical protein
MQPRQEREDNKIFVFLPLPGIWLRVLRGCRQLIEQEPGPRGSPHDPQGPIGTWVAPAAGPDVRAAKTD